eukprot:gnl/MRDRNA2_/MRDRNA2_95217_c0_seq1.p1 gnl/MRDRNA2_/MRDRNA2_95217_c0~~gnl/MRDRNA2_/MRDRNA2_95217_c0_seq1.p1  ORF type:complete len:952 (+),score=158.50 gnl/MRDRNA2_/MRDRNA2_95217_c0_seq1:76-2856(+)
MEALRSYVQERGNFVYGKIQNKQEPTSEQLEKFVTATTAKLRELAAAAPLKVKKAVAEPWDAHESWNPGHFLYHSDRSVRFFEIIGPAWHPAAPPNYKQKDSSLDAASLLSAFKQIKDGLQPLGNSFEVNRIPLTEHRAIRLQQLMDVQQQIALRCESEGWQGLHGAPLTPVSVNLYDAMKYYVKPMTEGCACSYVELVADGPQKPDYFVSHWWGEVTQHFVECLEAFAKDHLRGSWSYDQFHPDSTAYWVCAYANNQWSLGGDVSADPAVSSFRRAMEISSGVVSIVDSNATCWTRVWCCYEVFCALIKSDRTKEYTYDVYTTGAGFTGGLTDGYCIMDAEKAERKAEREKDFPLELLEHAMKIDLTEAEASVDADRIHILNAIVGGGDLNAEPPASHAKFDELNNTLRGRLVAALWPRLVAFEPQHSVILRNSRLQHLSLRFDVTFTDASLAFLADSLPRDTLRWATIDCAQCLHITHKGTSQLCRKVAAIRKLRGFTFVAQSIAAGIKAFADTVSDEGLLDLEYLEPSGGSLGDQGACALAGLFARGQLPKIKSLDLRNEGVGDAGALAIAEMLQVCSSIEILHLEGNKIGDRGGAALAEALLSNMTLQVFCFANNSFSEEFKSKIPWYMQKRRCDACGGTGVCSNTILYSGGGQVTCQGGKLNVAKYHDEGPNFSITCKACGGFVVQEQYKEPVICGNRIAQWFIPGNGRCKHCKSIKQSPTSPVSPRQNLALTSEDFDVIVERGPDWQCEDQDGGKGNLGKTIKGCHANGLIRVRWLTSTREVHTYRVGAEGKHDVQRCNDQKAVRICIQEESQRRGEVDARELNHDKIHMHKTKAQKHSWIVDPEDTSEAHMEQIERLKGLQKSCAGAKQFWKSVCDTLTPGVLDPAVHSQAFLETFCAGVESNSKLTLPNLIKMLQALP